MKTLLEEEPTAHWFQEMFQVSRPLNHGGECLFVCLFVVLLQGRVRDLGGQASVVEEFSTME